MNEILMGKKLLVVDDEPDIVESLGEFLDMCTVDKAIDFESAKHLLLNRPYDAAILDIMGVNGYELLPIANKMGIPAIMLTAHALSPDNFAQSMDGGACAYLPKDKLSEIDLFLADILEAAAEKGERLGKWFSRLSAYYDKKFGSGWLDQYKGEWQTRHMLP